MKYMFGDGTAVEVARGQLDEEQIIRLDEVLALHDLPASSPHTIPNQLAWVCLKCGSIAEAPDTETRDFCVTHFNMTCCGLTVIFHSSQKVLVDPSNLTHIKQEES